MDTTGYQALVAQRISQAMEDHDATELGLSSATGIPRTTLRRKLEARPNSPFTVVDVALIAAHLGVDVDSLLAVGSSAA